MIRCVAISLFLSSCIFPQELIDEYIEQVLNGNISNATDKLPEYQIKYPNHAGVLYLGALLEMDGDKAKENFIFIYNNHRGSKYAENSIIKISEYYYTAGLYLQSADWLKKIPQYYSNSEHIDKSLKLFINSLIVSGNIDSAVYYSKVFKKQFPDIKIEDIILEVKKDYQSSSIKSNIKPEENKVIVNKPEATKPKENKNIIVKIQDLLDRVKNDITAPINEYSLQVGAFGKRSNAKYQKQILIDNGYNARIDNINSNGILLYIVRVGYYNSQSEAKSDQKKIQSSLAIDTIIIKNE